MVRAVDPSLDGSGAMLRIAWLLVLIVAATGLFATAARKPYPEAYVAASGEISNGEYMFYAAGCPSCHRSSTETLELGGGVEIETPFGKLIAPNISPDPTFGIGAWSQAEFLNAVKAGVSPRGAHYYPGFPYARYAGLTDADVLDIRAFIDITRPIAAAAQDHRLKFPFSVRRGVGFWKLANYRREAFTADTMKSPSVNRGRYLVEHAAHCGECHTPRNLSLGLDASRAFEGAKGFDGVVAPALTAERLAAAGEDAFIDGVLTQGLRLDSAPLEASKMIETVDNTRHLTEADRRAIDRYLTER